MNLKLLIVLLLFPIMSFGNMAQPWVDGAQHSALYGAKNCSVIKENIFIQIIHDDVYFAKYKINYTIYSNTNQTIPLVFIGIGLSEQKSVTVNGRSTQITKYNSENPSMISYARNDSLSVNEKDLISFEANLSPGENNITVVYDADLGYNTYGFVKTFKLSYSLYPSRFWKFFGPINLEIALGDKLEIESSNIGEPILGNSSARWTIKNSNREDIKIEISQKPNIIAKVLLLLHPIGIALLSLILMIIIELKLIREKYKHKNTKYRYVLSIGTVAVPILFYAIYFASYPLIDFILGQENSQHGYVFLFIFTLPFFMLLYGILMYFFDRSIRVKYEN